MKSVAFVFLAAGLAACGGLGTTSGPAADIATSFTPTSGHMPLVYVSDHTNNLIDVFDLRGKLLHTITSGLNAPVGLFVDASENFVGGKSRRKRRVSLPAWLDDAERDAGRFQSTQRRRRLPRLHGLRRRSLNLGGVAVYPLGRMTLTRRLVAQQSGESGLEFYVACDGAGNVFATGVIGASPFAATVGWRHARQSGYYLLEPTATSESGIKATAARRLLIPTYDTPPRSPPSSNSRKPVSRQGEQSTRVRTCGATSR